MSEKENKMKGLLPSLRQKKRFIVFKIETENNYKFDFKDVSYEILDQLILFLGSIDFSNGGIWLLRDKFNKEKQIFYLRVSTKLKNKTIAALLLIDKLQNYNVRIKILGVSGTLRGAKNFEIKS